MTALLALLLVLAPAPAPEPHTWKACPTDEGEQRTPCVWDARHQGNGKGHSFVVTRKDQVIRITHRRAVRLLEEGCVGQ